MSFRPFRILGLISYGVYLWHWPVDVALTRKRAHVGGWPLFALQTLVTLAISGVSYRFLEQPIRRGALSAKQWRRQTPVVAIGLVLVLLGTTHGATSPPVAASPDSSLAGAMARLDTAPSGAKRIMVVGNSVAYFLGGALEQAKTDPPIVALNAGLAGQRRGHAGGHRSWCRGEGDFTWPRLLDQMAGCGPGVPPDIGLFILSGGGAGGGSTVRSYTPATARTATPSPSGWCRCAARC